jgi:3'(2'), 5'-bisphosphate nucleotidase
MIDRRLVDELTTVVSRAAERVRTIADAGIKSTLKPDQTPVTSADIAAEELILGELARLAPGVPAVSEESVTGKRLPQAHAYFLVDPIDGTRDFVAGGGEYTINIGFVRAGIPVLGIIAAPASGHIWRTLGKDTAERMTLAPGASFRDARDVTPLQGRSWAGQEAVAIVSRSHLDAATTALLDRLPVAERIRCGSSLKFCRLAEGAGDLYPRLAPTSAWDLAAGHAILLAAGGTVLKPDGQPLRYNAGEDLTVPGFIAWADPTAASRFAR